MRRYVLLKAYTKRDDEYYTRLQDIENELQHYANAFRGKIVYCPCDDPTKSNFFKYFVLNFNTLGLKKLIATSYVESELSYGQITIDKGFRPYKVIIQSVDGDNYSLDDLLKNRMNSRSLLSGDGDFRSEECVNLLKEADIIATNPPFSLFREFIDLLVKYNKLFIILGSNIAICYKNVFPLIKSGDLRIGVNKVSLFDRLDGTTKGVMAYWYTNVDSGVKKDLLTLTKSYYKDPTLYPKYDNYNAIEVSKVADIPYDYEGIMGVPLNFIDKYNPDQFEILGLSSTPTCYDNSSGAERTKIYYNLTVHDKRGGVKFRKKLDESSVIIYSTAPKGRTYYTVDGIDGFLVTQFVRILIRRKDFGLEWPIRR